MTDASELDRRSGSHREPPSYAAWSGRLATRLGEGGFDSPLAQGLAVVALLLLVAAVVTWPQVTGLSTSVARHEDPLLSMWRLAWIAHALVTNPGALFHAPIFYSEARTLAYTDAVLLPALVGAPFIWLGAPLIVVYNTLLLGSMVLSGLAAWQLAKRLTGNGLAAIVAALAFAFAPFRFDHYEHLELQASFGLPWTLLALEGVMTRGRWRDAAHVGLAFAVLIFCSIYYAVFTATLAPIYCLIRFGWRGLFQARVGLLRTLVALACTAVLATPYLGVYSRNREVVGERPLDERYSATLIDFVHVHPNHLLLGRWLGEYSKAERRLFPGVTVSVLALLALVLAPGRRTFALAAVVVGAALIALGMNAFLVPFLREYVMPYRGLRVPARAAMAGQLAIAVLATYAVARMLPAARMRAAIVVALVGSGVVVDALHVPLNLTEPSAEPRGLSQWLQSRPEMVVLELPLAQPWDFYLEDGKFMYAAAAAGRWNRTVNGYSGFYPRTYVRLLEVMQTFPDDHSMEYLRWREVDVIAVHLKHFPSPDKYGEVLSAMLARRDLIPTQRTGSGSEEVLIFELAKR